MKEVVLRKSQEVTALGKTRVQRVYVRGYMDQEKNLRLSRVVGLYGEKMPPKSNSDTVSRAA